MRLFHGNIPPLTVEDRIRLNYLAIVVSEQLKPGCDCAHTNVYGHTAACRIHQEYMREAEQRLNEATELRMTWSFEHASRHTTIRTGFDLQMYLTQEFRPSGAGWVGFIQL